MHNSPMKSVCFYNWIQHLDIDKAYDTIGWSFLPPRTMEVLRFGRKICQVVVRLGARSSYGWGVGSFQVKRSIRQGYPPLSLLLFTICSHPLMTSLEEEPWKRNSSGMVLPNANQLLFVDGSLLYLKAKTKSL